MKRTFDLTVASMLLVVFSPMLLIVAIFVRWRLGAPILFKQQRPGRHAVPFYIYKFRTMKDAWDAQGNPLSDEARLTRFGRFLRRFSLDELPQLVNVVKGDLSLVGPRPLLMEYVGLYTEEQARRHEVRPGITGWAQIHGRNALSWEEKFQLDVWYVTHRSFWLDLNILWRTCLKVVRPEGISHATHATMPEFRGSSRKAEGGGAL